MEQLWVIGDPAGSRRHRRCLCLGKLGQRLVRHASPRAGAIDGQ